MCWLASQPLARDIVRHTVATAFWQVAICKEAWRVAPQTCMHMPRVLHVDTPCLWWGQKQPKAYRGFFARQNQFLRISFVKDFFKISFFFLSFFLSFFFLQVKFVNAFLDLVCTPKCYSMIGDELSCLLPKEPKEECCSFKTTPTLILSPGHGLNYKIITESSK